MSDAIPAGTKTAIPAAKIEVVNPTPVVEAAPAGSSAPVQAPKPAKYPANAVVTKKGDITIVNFA